MNPELEALIRAYDAVIESRGGEDMLGSKESLTPVLMSFWKSINDSKRKRSSD